MLAFTAIPWVCVRVGVLRPALFVTSKGLRNTEQTTSTLSAHSHTKRQLLLAGLL
jgi:hypothetical protein